MMPAQALALFLLLAALPGNAPQPAPEKGQARLPATIAVISGQNKDANLLAVDLLTKDLAKETHLTVLPPQRVAGLPDYPRNIRGPLRTEYVTATVDYDNTDLETIKRIRQQLGVDYLYVVWMQGVSSTMLGRTTLRYVTQLFAGPDGAPVYNGGFKSSASGGCGGFTLCLGIKFKYPTAEEQVRQLKESCETHAIVLEEEIEALEKTEKP